MFYWKIKVNKQIVCKTCDGTGAKDRSSVQTCKTCGGQGAVRRVTNTILGQMQTTSTCPTCNGEGTTITSKCTVCHGDGVVRGEETISINIPAGVSEGMQLSMSGKGNAAPRGGVPGDLSGRLSRRRRRAGRQASRGSGPARPSRRCRGPPGPSRWTRRGRAGTALRKCVEPVALVRRVPPHVSER